MIDYMDRNDAQFKAAMTAAMAQSPKPDRARCSRWLRRHRNKTTMNG